jgi:hypothetical protein
MSAAWAVEIREDHYCAILSEAGASFNRDFMLKWVDVYKEGYFLMHWNTPLNCTLITPEKFFQLYQFDSSDVGVMFRRVHMRQ